MNTLLSASQIDSFHRDGFLLLKAFVPAQTCDELLQVTHEHIQQAIAPLEYEAEVGYAGAPASLDTPGGRTARRRAGIGISATGRSHATS